MFIREGKKYQVFPMDASVAARIVAPRPNITAGRTEFVYTHPMVGLPQGDSPMLLDASYTITADITVPEGGAEGMIVTSGGRFAGYGFYLLKGKPVFLWNLVDLKRIKWAGPDALTPGKHTVEFDFKYDGLGLGTLAFNNMSGLGRPGTGTLKVDGKEVATQKMEKTLPMILQWDESFDIGSDTLTGVNDADYQAAVPAHGQAQQADDQGGPPAVVARGHQEARSGHAQQQDERIAAKPTPHHWGRACLNRVRPRNYATTMKRLLIVTAVIELGAGLALLGWPSAVVALLLGTPLEAPAAVALGRLAGAALCALGLACWLARYDPQSIAARGLISAMLLYNLGAVVILGSAGIRSHGIALWPAVVLHAVMTVWCILCHFQKPIPISK